MAEKRFEIRKVTEGDFSVLQISGIIDEQFNGKSLSEGLARRLVIDLGGVKRMSSFGIREWLELMHEAEKKCDEIYFISVPPRILDQFNMMADFGGNGTILSFLAPYSCDYCESEHLEAINVIDEWENISQKKLREKPCPECGNPSYLDEDPEAFLSFVASQPQPEPDAELLSFLSHRLKYKLSKAGMKLKIDKYIGTATYFRLMGDLDDSFPAEKILEGLEGAVIFDLKGLGEITEAGARRWSRMLLSLPDSVTEVYIKEAPEEFIQKLLVPESMDDRMRLLDFFMAYSCDSCGTTMDRLLDVKEHWEVLKFATAPELPCPDCGHPAHPKEPNSVVNLAHLKEPVPSKEILDFIKEAEEAIRQRAQIAKKRDTQEAEVAAAGSFWPMVTMIVILIAVLAGGGWYLMTQMKHGSDASDTTEHLVHRSSPKRPPWIGQKLYGSEGDTVWAVGYSFESDMENSAVEAAKDAAVDNLLYFIGEEVARKNALWKTVVFDPYSQRHNAVLSQLRRSRMNRELYIQRLSQVHESRSALKNIVAGAILPQMGDVVRDVYWERYQAGQRVFHKAWARISLSKADFDKLVKQFASVTQYKGVVLTGYYPGLIWLHPEVAKGVIILSLKTDSPFNNVLKAGYVVTQIENDDVARVQDFKNRFEALYKVGLDKRVCQLSFHYVYWNTAMERSSRGTASYKWKCPKEKTTVKIIQQKKVEIKVNPSVNVFPDQ